jgi:hypothetical protein
MGTRPVVPLGRVPRLAEEIVTGVPSGAGAMHHPLRLAHATVTEAPVILTLTPEV